MSGSYSALNNLSSFLREGTVSFIYSFICMCFLEHGDRVSMKFSTAKCHLSAIALWKDTQCFLIFKFQKYLPYKCGIYYTFKNVSEYTWEKTEQEFWFSNSQGTNLQSLECLTIGQDRHLNHFLSLALLIFPDLTTNFQTKI